MKEIRKNTCYYILIVTVIFCYSFFYFNRTITDIEGWDSFYITLLKQGKMIYKDFYYYLPPLYILRYGLLWEMFNGKVLILRFFGILGISILFVLIFAIFNRFMNVKKSFIATILGYFVYNSLTFNNYGGYTQLSQTFLALVVLCLSNAFSAPASYSKRKYYWICAAGFCIAQVFMSKQSIGAVAIGAFLIAIILYCMIFEIGKEWWKYILGFFAGMIAGFVPYIVWLVITGAWDSFISGVIIGGAAAKGVSLGAAEGGTSQIHRVFLTLFSLRSLVYITVTFLVVKLRDASHKYNNEVISVAYHLGMIGLFVFVADTCQIHLLFRDLIALCKEIVSCNYYIIFLGGILGIILFGYIKGINMRGDRYPFFISIIAIISCGVLYSLNIEKVLSIQNSFEMSTYTSNIYEYSFWICNVWLFYQVTKKWRKEEMNRADASWFFIVAADVNAVVSLFGGGDGKYATNGALFTVCFSVYLLLNFIHKIGNITVERRVYQICVPIIIGVVAISTMSVKVLSPYSFWGWSEEPITDAASYDIEFERYKGLLVSKRDKVTIEQITRLVEQNTNEKDFVFTFPYSKVYNLLSNRTYMPTYVPIYYFDVCPDEFALKDLDIIKEDIPDMIVWKELGEGCWTSNEQGYRGGNISGQRKIREWFESVRDTEYVLIGKVYNQYVYLRKDKPINYQFFDNAVDMTSKETEVKENIYRSNVLSWFCNLFADNEVTQLNVKYFMLVVLLILFVMTLLCADNGAEVWLISIILFGFLMKITYVYYLVLVVPLLLYFRNFSKKKYWDNIRIIGIALSVVSLCFFWNKNMWNIMQYVFWLSIVVLLLLEPISFVRKYLPIIKGKYKFKQ